MDSSAFKDQPRNDGSGKSDVWFNGPGDGSRHGHVVQSVDANGNPVYHHVRDVEGNVYVDRGVVFFVALAVGIALAAGIITPSKGFEPTLQGAANTLITLAAAAGGALVGLFAPSSSGTSAAG